MSYLVTVWLLGGEIVAKIPCVDYFEALAARSEASIPGYQFGTISVLTQ